MWNVSFAWGAAEWGMCHAAQEYFSRRCHRSTQKPCGVLVNNTDCAAGAEDRHRYFAGGELCGRMSHDGLAWYAKNLEIREICGRQLSAQCAKEQAGCFYSPTDLSDKHRCHADCLSITQIAPSARQIDTDFSHAENLSMRARFNGYAPRGQKFIAQGKRSGALGIMCCVVCAL